ncbi:MAG: hypothetical protein EOP40_11685 [Rubrivivax sp.]|nr:MAG: hypothetical protein EOP40_11685 [Rubrivivax sp.]
MTVFKTTRRALLTFIGGLTIFRKAASEVVDAFTLVPQFEPGQVLRYRQDLQHVRNGEIACRSRSMVTLEVGGRTSNGWLVRWTASGSEILEAHPGMRPLLEVMQALWDGIPIDLLVDDGGRLIGLADPQTVKARGDTSLEHLLARMSADPASAPMAPALHAALQPMLANGHVLMQSLMKEPAMLLGAMGHDYRVGEPLEGRTRIASPLGQGEIAVLGRYQLRGISAAEHRADIGWLMVIDRPATVRLLSDEILGAVRRAEAALPVADEDEEEDAPEEDKARPIEASTVTAAMASLDFDDRGDFIVDTRTAWPVSVRHVRRVSTAAGSRVETVELKRLAL